MKYAAYKCDLGDAAFCLRNGLWVKIENYQVSKLPHTGNLLENSLWPHCVIEVCTGSKLKPEPGPYPRSSDPTRPDPSGTVKFRARTRPEIPPPPPPHNE